MADKDLVKTALRLLNTRGREISFIKLNESPLSVNEPWKGPPSTGENSLILKGVFVPPVAITGFGLSALGEGTQYRDLVTFSEQIIIVSPGEIDLRDYTKVIDRNDRWGITSLQVLRPGKITILGFVGVRR